jgi:adenylate cyclase class IV
MYKNIEIEFRSLLDEGKYKQLVDFLLKNGEDLGDDDKDTYFFIFKDKLLKVVKNLSKGTGKVVLKLNKLGKGSDFEEIEIPLKISEVDRMADLFSALKLPAQLIHNDQKRHNFLYKGVEIAVKYSIDWGYHAELEIVIKDSGDKESAEVRIQEVAKELGLRLMTDDEVLKLTGEIEARYRKEERQK